MITSSNNDSDPRRHHHRGVRVSSSSFTLLTSSSRRLHLVITVLSFGMMIFNAVLMWSLLTLSSSQSVMMWQVGGGQTRVAEEEEHETDKQHNNMSNSSMLVRREEQKTKTNEQNITFGHVHLNYEPDLFYYPIPPRVDPSQTWRYRSNGVYWKNTSDALYVNFHKQLISMRLQQDDNGAIIPRAVLLHQKAVSRRLQQHNLSTLARIWDNSYTFTLQNTTFPLHDGTTYLITGDIPLMWIRDSCAQVQAYVGLLGESPELLALVEGLLRRQSLFLALDPYATSFRLFLDFDFKQKQALTEWDYQSGRTIHVAMHNYELDNLAYHLKLSYELFQYYRGKKGPMRALDSTWLKTLDMILTTVEREQNHNESQYTYPELPYQGKGNPVCDGGGLSWSGFRPSDDQTTYGYLIPANQMMVVSLRKIVEIVKYIDKDDETRVERIERLAQSMDEGIHKHGVVEDSEFGKMYAYEVDACGKTNLMDDANIPSLLSLPYLEYTSPHDPDNMIRDNTRRFVLSSRNKFFYQNSNGNRGIGSPHTPSNNVWHLSVIMQALTTTSDDELREMMDMLIRTATNDLMHESFNTANPSRFTRKSFAWANSLFAELISTRLDDIVRVMGRKVVKNGQNVVDQQQKPGLSSLRGLEKGKRLQQKKHV